MNKEFHKRMTQRGQGLVELALTMPVLMLVVAGLIHFGMSMYTQQILTNASRVGARRATQLQGNAGAVQDAVRDYCERAGLDRADVQVQVDINSNTGRATVTVSYPFRSPVELLVGAAAELITGGSIDLPEQLQATTVMRL